VTTRSTDEKVDEILAILRSSERREYLSGHGWAQTVQVDLSGIRPGLGTVAVMITPKMTVSDFLDNLYGRLAPHLPPFTYGQTWALKMSYDSPPMRELGSFWAARNGTRQDGRLLSAVGIVPEMSLVAVLLQDAYGS
jgi:hypothetical protein